MALPVFPGKREVRTVSALPCRNFGIDQFAAVLLAMPVNPELRNTDYTLRSVGIAGGSLAFSLILCLGAFSAFPAVHIVDAGDTERRSVLRQVFVDQFFHPVAEAGFSRVKDLHACVHHDSQRENDESGVHEDDWFPP